MFIAIVEKDYEEPTMFFELKSETMETALEEFHWEMFQENFDGGQIYNQNDVDIIESANVYEIKAVRKAPIQQWYNDELLRITRTARQANEANEKAEYERLKEKYA